MTTHKVEIHVRRENQFTDPQHEVIDPNVFNDIGIVIPASLGIPKVENGDAIEFHYCLDESGGEDKRVTISFPKKWSTVDERSLEIVLGEDPVTWVSAQSDQNAKGKMKYMVFCHSIGEYAVGDSPPDMIFHP